MRTGTRVAGRGPRADARIPRRRAVMNLLERSRKRCALVAEVARACSRHARPVFLPLRCAARQRGPVGDGGRPESPLDVLAPARPRRTARGRQAADMRRSAASTNAAALHAGCTEKEPRCEQAGNGTVRRALPRADTRAALRVRRRRLSHLAVRSCTRPLGACRRVCELHMLFPPRALRRRTLCTGALRIPATLLSP